MIILPLLLLQLSLEASLWLGTMSISLRLALALSLTFSNFLSASLKMSLYPLCLPLCQPLSCLSKRAIILIKNLWHPLIRRHLHNPAHSPPPSLSLFLRESEWTVVCLWRPNSLLKDSYRPTTQLLLPWLRLLLLCHGAHLSIMTHFYSHCTLLHNPDQ